MFAAGCINVAGGDYDGVLYNGVLCMAALRDVLGRDVGDLRACMRYV